MDWKYINSTEDLPPESVYVLVKFDDDFIGISRYIYQEWETHHNRKIQIFTGVSRMYTGCDPQAWKYLN